MASEIKGYTNFIRDTREIQRDLPKAMGAAAREIAMDWMTAAQGLAHTGQQQQAAQSLEVGDMGTEGATLSSNSPIFFGAEFGGQSRPSTMQFPPHMGRRGYFLYPAKRQNQEHFDTIWDRGIEAAMRHWNHKE